MNQQQLVQDRIRKIVAILIVVFLLFGLRLIDIQAIRAKGFVNRANNELSKSATLLAPRGTISDINGVELARSISAINIAVDQTVVNDPITAAKIVAPILGMSYGQLLPEITGERRYVLIAKDITPAKWREVNVAIESYNTEVLKSKDGISKRIGGFVPERSYIRDYPSGAITSSLIGIINDQGTGAAGIESSLNGLLSGVNGKYIYANGRGNIIPGSEQVSVEASQYSSNQARRQASHLASYPASQPASSK
jgi:cell division protein FtsI (penicillin-binding protein 3)